MSNTMEPAVVTAVLVAGGGVAVLGSVLPWVHTLMLALLIVAGVLLTAVAVVARLQRAAEVRSPELSRTRAGVS